MLARCPGAFFLFCLPLVVISSGCRNASAKRDVLEIELRTREQLYRDLQEEHQRAEGRITALQMEVEALRKGSKITPELAASTYGLRRIVLGRSTGGLDNDNKPGDELLQVVVEPRDYDDQPIKAPGTMQIVAKEITPQGVKLPLSTWDISAEQLRRSWKQGLLSTGYSLTLPWKQLPVYENVRVTVRFVTPDQREYEADRDVKVRLVPGAVQKRLEMPPAPETLPLPPRGPLPEFGPLPENGPTLLPTGRVTPTPHVTQWRPIQSNSGVTIGAPRPLD